MKNLFKVTPGFALEYSGVCSVLYELGGLCVMIDPGDCLEHSIYVDDPRWDEEPRLFFSPRLRELDAVVGDDDKLITKLLRAVRLLEPKFLALIGSPVPTVIGTDLKAICRIVEKKTPAIEGGKAMYFVQSFFELFEVMLSYLSNTLSFVRVGAFAVSHAAMMQVVMMLAGAENGQAPNVIVVIVGNLVVMGMEGLIVGIQVLRLQYYEFFSRFYKGDGRKFEPYLSKEENI